MEIRKTFPVVDGVEIQVLEISEDSFMIRKVETEETDLETTDSLEKAEALANVYAQDLKWALS